MISGERSPSQNATRHSSHPPTEGGLAHRAKRYRLASASPHLEETGGTHAAADAHRDDDVFDVAPLAFQERVHRHAGAAQAVRVTDRDRAAVDVEALVGNAQLVAAVDGLHGEGFVEFP